MVAHFRFACIALLLAVCVSVPAGAEQEQEKLVWPHAPASNDQ